MRSPLDPRDVRLRRVLALEDDWVAQPGRQDVTRVPRGSVWVEADAETRAHAAGGRGGAQQQQQQQEQQQQQVGASEGFSGRLVPLALLEGRVALIAWPPERAGRCQAAEHEPAAANRVMRRTREPRW